MTKKLLPALFICTVFHLSAALAAPVDVVKKVRPGVVTINVYNKYMQLSGSGNGFFINNNGEVVTNHHVMKGAFHSEIITAKGTKYPIVGIVAENPAKDLIKVKAQLPPGRIKPLSLRSNAPRLTEAIFVISRFKGVKSVVRDGIVTSVRGNSIKGNADMLQITAAVSPGTSGSPVFDLNGRVVGIASAYWKTGQNLNFAVMSRHIEELQDFDIIRSHSQWHLQKRAASNARWFVYTEPPDAMVRILNISDKFKQGIELTAGRYHIEVSKEGYKTYQDWVSCESGETKKLTIFLSKSPNNEIPTINVNLISLVQHLRTATDKMPAGAIPIRTIH